ncbi:hypothetical protein [Achromobacter aloeverae]
MKARRKNSLSIWTIEHVGASLVQMFSGQIRQLITRAEFEHEWVAA